MTRWLWYGNGVLALAAVVLLVVGVGALFSPAELGGSGEQTAAVGTARGGEGEEGPSALIRAAKQFSRRWEPPVGSLTVVIEPGEVLEKARWKVADSRWQESGATLEQVPVGQVSVEFSPVSGWQSPAAVQIELLRDQERQVTGKYLPPPPTGTLRVVVGPEEALTAGAQWRLAGGQWQASGSTVEAPVGVNQVEFKELTLWAVPVGVSVEVKEDELSEATASYTAKPQGGIAVQVLPAEVVPAARWRVDRGEWQVSGAVQRQLLVGARQVEFEAVEGWRKPEGVTVEVAADEVALVEGAYEKIPVGSVQVVIEPERVAAEARWRLGEGPWQANGQVVEEVPVGAGAVEFLPVNGWEAPAGQQVEVAANEVATVRVEYKRIPPPAPDFAVDTTIMIGNGGGMAWVLVPGEKLPKLVAVGESVGEYRLWRIGDGWAEFDREGYRFKLEVPLPEERSGNGTVGAFRPAEEKDFKRAADPKPGAPKPGDPRLGSPRQMPPQGRPSAPPMRPAPPSMPTRPPSRPTIPSR